MGTDLDPLVARLVAGHESPWRALVEGLISVGVARSAAVAARSSGSHPWRTLAAIDPRAELHDPNVLLPDRTTPLPTALPVDRLVVQTAGPEGPRLLQLAGWDRAAAAEEVLEALLLVAVLVSSAEPEAPLPGGVGRGSIAPPTPRALLGPLWSLLGAGLEARDRRRWEAALDGAQARVEPRGPKPSDG